jgi:hypothetical protein
MLPVSNGGFDGIGVEDADTLASSSSILLYDFFDGKISD